MTEEKDWREEFYAESVKIGKELESRQDYRIGKTRRTECKGGCGRRTWSDYCRKCRRAMERAARKGKR